MAIQKAAATSNYLSTPTSPFFNPQRPFTLMMWVRFDTITTTNNGFTSVMGTYSAAGGVGWEIRSVGNGTTASIGLQVSGTAALYNDYFNDGILIAGRWMHYAVAFDFNAAIASRRMSFLDGSPLTQGTAIGTDNTNIPNASGILRIGQDADNATSFNGALAYVRMFDGLLTQAEVVAEMRSTTVVNRRVPALFDFPLEASGGANVIGVDRGQNRLHATSKTGTVNWDAPPRLPKRETGQLLQQDPHLWGSITGGGVSLAGAVANLALAAPAGSVATQTNAALTGAAGAVALAAPAGTVAVQRNVTLTGVVAGLALAAPAGMVATQVNVALTGAVGAVALAAPAGTVSAQGAVALMGAVGLVALAAPAGTVAMSVTLTGAVAPLALAAPAGTTSSTFALTGPVANLTLAAPAGTVATGGAVSLSGAVANLAISAPAGTVATGGNVNLTGAVAAVTLSSPAGTVSTQRNVTLSGPVSAVSLAALAGSVATQQVVALTGVSTGLGLSAPAGSVTITSVNDGKPVPNPAMALTVPTSALALAETGTLTLDRVSTALVLADAGRLALTSPDSRLELT